MFIAACCDIGQDASPGYSPRCRQLRLGLALLWSLRSLGAGAVPLPQLPSHGCSVRLSCENAKMGTAKYVVCASIGRQERTRFASDHCLPGSSGLQANEVLYSSLISACGGQWQAAMAIMQLMCSDHIRPEPWQQRGAEENWHQCVNWVSIGLGAGTCSVFSSLLACTAALKFSVETLQQLCMYDGIAEGDCGLRVSFPCCQVMKVCLILTL